VERSPPSDVTHVGSAVRVAEVLFRTESVNTISGDSPC